METQTVDPPTVQPELNLLLAWPDERGQRWRTILGASLSVHLLLFFAAVKLPAFVRLASPPESRTVVIKRTPLYLPRDVLTQRAPNRNKLSKQIDLADLLASQASPARASAPQPKPRRFELPKQTTPEIAKNAPPQITVEPPSVALNEAAAPAPIAHPASPENPFQNVAPQPQKSPKPAAPKSTVQTAIDEAHRSNRKVAISDDTPIERLPGSPGSIERTPAQHAAIELESDPQGTDFKPYLARILAIVRSNWRTVIPESVRMGTRRGRTVIEFAINRDGSIPKLVIADPSGSEPLDRAAVAGLSMSNPLPPLPSDYKGLQVRLAFSFAYNMPAQ
ncbi:MAG: TonB family protein [Acidobacteriaceae bacterium]|nr:TonB family protein [Acidobacteriaceae bacterium]MBV9779896.1 TonB family protein [Acidobacteriaceae bacterium]